MADLFTWIASGIVIGGIIGFVATTAAWRAETVERGLAIYCPADGEWAWIGECEGAP